MPQRPEPIKRLDSVFSTALIAHEAIFEMRRELVASGQGTQEGNGLLDESARITLGSLPRIARKAYQVASRWDEQEVLDPDVAAVTLRELEAELDRIAGELKALLNRQREIASRLRSMLDR